MNADYRGNAKASMSGDGARRARDLGRLLAQLEAMNVELLDLVNRKIAAMRQGRIDELGVLNQQEARLVHRIRERDGLRRQLARLTVDGFSPPPIAGRAAASDRQVGLWEIVTAVGMSRGRELSQVGTRLREVLLRVRQRNRVASAMARETLNHMRWVFDRMRAQPASATYGTSPGPVFGREALLVDAIG